MLEWTFLYSNFFFMDTAQLPNFKLSYYHWNTLWFISKHGKKSYYILDVTKQNVNVYIYSIKLSIFSENFLNFQYLKIFSIKYFNFSNRDNFLSVKIAKCFANSIFCHKRGSKFLFNLFRCCQKIAFIWA